MPSRESGLNSDDSGRRRSTRTTRDNQNQKEPKNNNANNQNQPQPSDLHKGQQSGQNESSGRQSSLADGVRHDGSQPGGGSGQDQALNAGSKGAASDVGKQGGGDMSQSDGINAAAGAAGRAVGEQQAKKGKGAASKEQGGKQGSSSASSGQKNKPSNSADKNSRRSQSNDTDSNKSSTRGQNADSKSNESSGINNQSKSPGDKDSASSKLAGAGGESEDHKQNGNANGADNNNPEADPTADPKTGMTGGLNGIGADATGVDYSDKKLGDRLEHQAADVAMDATPYLGQVNSARKALKNYNKEKNAAGGDDDQLSDKVEEGADKVVDGGINTAKAAGVGVGGGAMGIGAMMALMFVKTLTLVKAMGGMAMGLLASIGSAISSAFATVTSFLAATLSIGTTAATALLSTVIAGVLVVTSVVGMSVASPRDAGNAASNACSPTNTAVVSGVMDRIESDGETTAQREENAGKLWSVYSELGGTKTQTAAVLGNLHVESVGLDPTAVETILDEPFLNGPKKQAAEAAKFDVKVVAPAYAADYPAIQQMGIGLAQWTNGRNLLLQAFAEEQDMPWHEFDTQMMFMLEGDEGYRQDQLLDFIKSGSSNVDTETERFMNTWIGLTSPNDSLGKRLTAAKDYAFMLERATADKDYAEGILAGVNIDKSEGNNAAGAFHQDDGCGDTVKSHYANVSVDGTGAVPTDLTLTPWKRDDLPESLKKYAVNPEDTGIAWGNAEGWAPQILPDQCVALSDSYMVNLYPEWNKGGRSTQKPNGNGHVTASVWAAHFGETTSKAPQKGAVFSSNVFPPYGHTGIVMHVFENGDILAVEQNIRGYSGQFAPGLNYSWSWQVYRKGTYESENWDFFKPSEFEPQWYKDGRTVDTPDESESDSEDVAA